MADTIQNSGNTPSNTPVTVVNEQPSGSGRTIFAWFLGAALALSLGANIYQAQKTQGLSTDIGTLKSELTSVKSDLQKNNETVQKSVAGMEQALAAAKEEVSKKMAQQTRTVVQRQSSRLDNTWKKQQAEQVEKLNSELLAIRQAADANASRLGEINTEVGGVKTEVGNVKTEMASARTELDRTIGDLKRVRGDMGEMSGLIATNHQEFLALKSMGERNYYEFNLAKSAGQQRVGDVQLEVRKADLKKGRYTLNLVVDDRKIEKKDKTVNEPVQFYASAKSRQPYELVVYEVQKNRVIGYLATPKMQVARQ